MSKRAILHREFAPTVVVDTVGRLLMQLRDDIPTILYPGRIGLFGGHREGNETFLECAVRELHEELSYYLPPHRFEALASWEGLDRELPGVTVREEYFVVRDVPVECVEITEGRLYPIEIGALPTVEQQLTPSARFAVGRFLERTQKSSLRRAGR